MKTINAKVTSVTLECPRCLSFHEIGVRLVSAGCSQWCNQSLPHDEPDFRYEIPDNCGCGEPLDNPKNCREVEDTAVIVFTLAGIL